MEWWASTQRSGTTAESSLKQTANSKTADPNSHQTLKFVHRPQRYPISYHFPHITLPHPHSRWFKWHREQSPASKQIQTAKQQLWGKHKAGMPVIKALSRGKEKREKKKKIPHWYLLLIFHSALHWKCTIFADYFTEVLCTQFQAGSIEKSEESNQSNANFMEKLPVFGYKAETFGKSSNSWNTDVTAGKTKQKSRIIFKSYSCLLASIRQYKWH